MRVLQVVILAMAILPLAVGSPYEASAAAKRSRIVTAGGGLWTHDSAGGDRRQILDGVVGQGPYQPHWSHDGQWIAYTYSFEIWVVGADGRGARKVSGGFRTAGPTWSADDRRIYFTSVRDGALTRIEWVSLDGTDSGTVPTGEANASGVA